MDTHNEGVKTGGIVLAGGSLLIGVLALPTVGLGPMVMAGATIGLLLGCGVLSWSGLGQDINTAKTGMKSSYRSTAKAVGETYGESKAGLTEFSSGVNAGFKDVPKNLKDGMTIIRHSLKKD